MGEVWAGRDRNLHRDVAVKLLIRDDDASPDLLHRFEREAVAVAQINHPHVVSLYDRGVHDGLQFLIMEKIAGITLTHHIHDQAPMPTTRALEIAQEICAALVAAHRANVIHYDIKPSNVMIGADGHIKVIDFGIAGFTHAHTFTVVPTTMLSPVGTALYGAPEQFLDQRGDERSDLYALGSVLFALLTGNPPFGEGGPLSVGRHRNHHHGSAPCHARRWSRRSPNLRMEPRNGCHVGAGRGIPLGPQLLRTAHPAQGDGASGHTRQLHQPRRYGPPSLPPRESRSLATLCGGPYDRAGTSVPRRLHRPPRGGALESGPRRIAG
ncbi:serine/threonine-protein kinase [Streptosporangium sp. NPDC048047]|uniref:serine/threonine-protein kinase n=1 Tax=Streptosporangium sp. NPDC048047 TaxID=3155748 RepID=UPI00343BFC5F